MHPLDDWISGARRGWLANAVRGMLWLASYPYGLVMLVRNRAYDLGWLKQAQSSIPVVSVGNLTVGGTGKTPAVAFLARWFRERQVRVAIVSRGYGALENDRNDEAKELEEKLPDVPHLQNPDRIAAVQLAFEELDSQLVLLDDGFQHRRLARDLNILMLDALEPFGYGHLLPRGLLREPIRSLKRVDVIIVSRADQVSDQKLADLRTVLQRYAPKAAWVEAIHEPQALRNYAGEQASLDRLAGARVLAFCGLGNPRGFLQTLRQRSVNVVDQVLFPDHHPFQASDLERLAQLAHASKADMFVCTGKDLPKIGLTEWHGMPIWALDISLTIQAGLEPLEERLQQVLARVEQAAIDPTENA
jgi:tetraacyldisaccharide 4'-kinase